MTKTTNQGASRRRRNWSGERGSIVIPVAVSLLGLLAFSSFTIDYGVMMSARRQAQNSADAGALAAALYLAWDDSTDLPGAQAMGVAAAQLNQVFGGIPDVTVSDVTFPTCPPGAPGPVDQCVQVEVFRNQRAGGNPLPTFFGQLVGMANQGVTATATAQVLYGEGTGPGDCVKPFAIPDRWLELREDEANSASAADDDGTNPPNFPYDEDHGDLWDADDSYDSYYTQGGNRGQPLAPGPRDDYTPTSGYQLTQDTQSTSAANSAGIRLELKSGTGGQIAPSWYYPFILNCGGASCYRDAIEGCSTRALEVDDPLTNEPGNMVGPTAQGISNLIAQDPGAYFHHTNPGGQYPRGTILGGLGMESPRLAVVPTFNPETYMQGHQNGRISAGNAEIVITGMVGIFFDHMQGNTAVGHLMPIDFEPTPDNLSDDTSSFQRSVILVR